MRGTASTGGLDLGPILGGRKVGVGRHGGNDNGNRNDSELEEQVEDGKREGKRKRCGPCLLGMEVVVVKDKERRGERVKNVEG